MHSYKMGGTRTKIRSFEFQCLLVDDLIEIFVNQTEAKFWSENGLSS